MSIAGERLKELRVEARYSQKQISEMCETTQATIGRYETCVADPPIQKLLMVADRAQLCFLCMDRIFSHAVTAKKRHCDLLNLGQYLYGPLFVHPADTAER